MPLLSLAVAGFAATRIGTEFMPPLDEGAIAVNVVRLPNASLEGSVRVAAEVNVRGRVLGGFVAEAKQRLAEIEKELPPGYFLEYGGQFENQQRAIRRLSIVVPVALVLILLLLNLAFGSIRDSLLAVLNLGHLPMLYATGSGADIQKPLAVVVMGGLITSTLLTLVVLPTVYEWFEGRVESRVSKDVR